MTTFQCCFTYQVLNLFTNNKELAFKRILVNTVSAATYKNLSNNRLGGPYTDTQVTVIYRHITPTDQLLTLLSY